MQPFLILVREPPVPSEGGFSVGRPEFFKYIVMAETEEAAREAVEEKMRDGCKIEDCLGVAPASAIIGYKLAPDVPEVFHERT